MGGYLVLVFFAYFFLNLILAGLFQNVAALKGYGTEVHAFVVVFFLGIVGCIYVAALPDRVQQEQSQKIIDLMSNEKDVQ